MSTSPYGTKFQPRIGHGYGPFYLFIGDSMARYSHDFFVLWIDPDFPCLSATGLAW